MKLEELLNILSIRNDAKINIYLITDEICDTDGENIINVIVSSTELDKIAYKTIRDYLTNSIYRINVTYCNEITIFIKNEKTKITDKFLDVWFR